MSNYTIEKLNKDDFHLLIPLMENCFGMNVNIKYFEWKFINNPSGLFEGFIAKAEDGEVAAYYGVIPEIYIVNKVQKIIYQSCDTMTHSKHRRKGLFQKLALHCYEYLKKENKMFVIGFGGGQSTPGFLKFGWKHIFDIKYYFYPKFLSIFNKYKYANIFEIENFEEISCLIEQSNSRAVIHSCKNLEMFRWRLSNPLYRYYTVAAKSEINKYDSYITFYYSAEKIILFDFYFNNKISAKNLMNYLKQKLSKNNFKGIIAFVQENSLYSKILKKYGFISNPFKKGPLSQKTPFIFYAENYNLELYNYPEKWLINSFDHDAL